MHDWCQRGPVRDYLCKRMKGLKKIITLPPHQAAKGLDLGKNWGISPNRTQFFRYLTGKKYGAGYAASACRCATGKGERHARAPRRARHKHPRKRVSRRETKFRGTTKRVSRKETKFRGTTKRGSMGLSPFLSDERHGFRVPAEASPPRGMRSGPGMTEMFA